MTEKDLVVVARMVEDAIDDSLSMPSIDSIHLNEIYDRVEIQLSPNTTIVPMVLMDMLAQRFGRYRWDTWMPAKFVIAVGEKERER